MFNTQYLKIKLVYAGFGGFLMLIGKLLSPVTAQRDKFGVIECTELRVVDADGNELGKFAEDESGGLVLVKSKDGQARAEMRLDEYGELATISAAAKMGKASGHSDGRLWRLDHCIRQRFGINSVAGCCGIRWVCSGDRER